MPRFENRTRPRWVRPEPSIPLRGFVFDETSDWIWMAWRLGNWKIRKTDVLAREPWETTAVPGNGAAEIVYIRVDAEIDEIVQGYPGSGG